MAISSGTVEGACRRSFGSVCVNREDGSVCRASEAELVGASRLSFGSRYRGTTRSGAAERASGAEGLHMSAECVQYRLSTARRAGRLLRWRISGTCIAVGVMSFILSFAFLYIARLVCPPESVSFEITKWLAILFNLTVVVAMVHAVLPTDRWLGRIIVGIVCLGCAAETAIVLPKRLALFRSATNLSDDSPMWLLIVDFLRSLGIMLLSVILCHGMLFLHPRALLERFAVVMRRVVEFMGTVQLAQGIAFIVTGDSILQVCSSVVHGAMYGLVSLALHQSIRGWIRGFLIGRDGNVMAAGAIAAMMAGMSDGPVLALARNLFHCIICDRILKEHMADNRPNPDLHALSMPARYGEVDAFVSHSWSDDPDYKWDELQKWRKAFKARHSGQEPRLWVDKFCVNQSNIGSDLRCLPVFLSACDRLLVLAGETYLSRLWCIVEIFVFLQMGRSLSALDIRTFGDGPGISSWTVGELSTFTVKNATCFHPGDKDRILSFIEAAFGSINSFNDEVLLLLTGLNKASLASLSGPNADVVVKVEALAQPPSSNSQQESVQPACSEMPAPSVSSSQQLSFEL